MKWGGRGWLGGRRNLNVQSHHSPSSDDAATLVARRRRLGRGDAAVAAASADGATSALSVLVVELHGAQAGSLARRRSVDRRGHARRGRRRRRRAAGDGAAGRGRCALTVRVRAGAHPGAHSLLLFPTTSAPWVPPTSTRATRPRWRRPGHAVRGTEARRVGALDAAARELVGDGGSVDVHCWRGRMRSAARRTQPVHVAMCAHQRRAARCWCGGSL